MNIAITGSNGFIGRYLVEAALAQGHQVIAFVRRECPKSWQGKSGLRIVTTDLLSTQNLAAKLSGCDVIVHLAAAMSNSSQTQYSQTIHATENILAAMEKAKVNKLIGLSSISIINYVDQAAMSVIDENTTCNQNDKELGVYALMKRDQEKCYELWFHGQGISKRSRSLAILRPGIVYDEQNLSTAHVGFIQGNNGIAAIHNGYVPLVHVKSVVQAIIAQANVMESGGTNSSSANQYYELIHLTNDDLPTQSQYIDMLKIKGSVNILLPLPWRIFSAFSLGVRLLLALIGKSNKTPDSFIRNSVAGRQKPFIFSNAKAKKRLNWKPCSSIGSCN